eukprot:scaffold49129_cov21-Tisochrysis_lutea.AAC.1
MHVQIHILIHFAPCKMGTDGTRPLLLSQHMVWDMQLGALVSELMAQAAQEPQIGSRQKGSNNGQEDSSDGQEGTSNRREESSDRQENSSNRQGGSSTSSRGGP